MSDKEMRDQLQLALAKMLPEKIETWSQGDTDLVYHAWKRKQGGQNILDTEWLHVCQTVLASFSVKECQRYNSANLSLHDPWQRHAVELCKVKGITVLA